MDLSIGFPWLGFSFKALSTETQAQTQYACQHCLPCASDLPGLVPDLLQQGVVLDDDPVLDVGALGGGGAVAVRVPAGGHSALKHWKYF